MKSILYSSLCKGNYVLLRKSYQLKSNEDNFLYPLSKLSLGRQNRKKESRMVVDKRKGRETP